MEALESLLEPKTVVYRKRYKKGNRTLNDIVIVTAPLIQRVSRGYQGLEDEEAEDGASHEAMQDLEEVSGAITRGSLHFHFFPHLKRRVEKLRRRRRRTRWSAATPP